MFACMLVLAAFAVVAGDPPPGSPGGNPPMESLFPADDEVPGWRRQGEPDFYGPDHLYEYIDGAASGYLAYDFQQLAVLPYRFREEKEPALGVNLYRMSTPLNGFGIYSSERSPDLSFREWGTEGFVTEQLAAFWQGPYYVKIQVWRDFPVGNGRRAVPVAEVLEKFATSIAARLPGPREEPALLKAFPPEGKVARSEIYLREDLLGHKFLRNGFLVDYRFGGNGRQADFGFRISDFGLRMDRTPGNRDPSLRSGAIGNRQSGGGRRAVSIRLRRRAKENGRRAGPSPAPPPAGGSGRGRAFLCTLDSPEEAQDAYAKLRGFFAEYGEVHGPVEGLGEQAFRGKEPFYGRSLVCQRKNVLCGLVGVPDDKAGQSFVEDLLKRASAAVVGNGRRAVPLVDDER